MTQTNIPPEMLNAILSVLGQSRPTVCFAGYAERWFETFKRKKLRPGTQKTYSYLLRKHIVPFFGDKMLASIDVADIQEFYDSMSGLSRSTVRQMRVILHQIFRAAKEDKLILDNPTESDRLSITSKVTVREALPQEAIQDVVRQLPRLKGSDLLLLSILIYTGERRGEVLGLRWEDVDFDANMIHVQRAVSFPSNQPLLGETKSKAGVRSIPLLPELKAILEPHRKPEGFIIGDGEEPLTERAYRCAFRRIESKLDLHGATAHVFRHTFLTMAVDSLDLKTLQTIAGHASHVTTMRYVHQRNEKLMEARTKLTGMFGQ